MEYETLVEDAADRPRARAADPPVKAPASELSPTEQAAVGPAAGSSPALRPAVVIGLQRAAGNAAVTALIQRSTAPTMEEDEPSAVRDIVGQGRGQPLDPALKEEMEARLGNDLSQVRIHSDAAAAKSAAAVSARAYTVGNEVVLGPDSPALDSAAGKRTLAHELTHVIQQRQGPVSGTAVPGGISISDPSDVFEQAAEANADRVMSAGTGPAAEHGGMGAPPQGLLVQRGPAAIDTEEEEEETEAPPEEAQAEQAEEEAEAPAEEAQAEQAEEETEAPAEEAGAELEGESEEAEVPAEEAGAGLEGESEEAEAPAAEEAEVAEQEAELAEAGEEEAAEESGEEEASELEIEEDEVNQAEAQVEAAEEEEEEEPAAV